MAKIIALLGTKGSGKSTVAQIVSALLPERLVYQPGLADPIKRGVQAMFHVPSTHLFGASELRESPIDDLVRTDGSPLTVRYALQTLGTEWGRRYINDDIWIKLLIRYASSLPESAVVIVTDCRFLNEARALHSAGAELWRIQRASSTPWRRFLDNLPLLYRVGDLLGISPHASEREMWYRQMDSLVTRELDNTGSIEGLENQIVGTLAKLGMLSAE